MICLPPPDVPIGTPGRATFGAKVYSAELTINGVFGRVSSGAWISTWVPYTPGAGHAERRRRGRLTGRRSRPGAVTLAARTAGRGATLTGPCHAGRPGDGRATVTIFGGSRAGRLTSVGRARVAANGTFTFRARARHVLPRASRGRAAEPRRRSATQLRAAHQHGSVREPDGERVHRAEQGRSQEVVRDDAHGAGTGRPRARCATLRASRTGGPLTRLLAVALGIGSCAAILTTSGALAAYGSPRARGDAVRQRGHHRRSHRARATTPPRSCGSSRRSVPRSRTRVRPARRSARRRRRSWPRRHAMRELTAEGRIEVVVAGPVAPASLTGCAEGERVEGVWSLRLAAAGLSSSMPLYVLVGGDLLLCVPHPSSLAQGAKLVGLTLTLDAGLELRPAGTWISIWVPYGAAEADLSRAVASPAVVGAGTRGVHRPRTRARAPCSPASCDRRARHAHAHACASPAAARASAQRPSSARRRRTARAASRSARSPARSSAATAIGRDGRRRRGSASSSSRSCVRSRAVNPTLNGFSVQSRTSGRADDRILGPCPRPSASARARSPTRACSRRGTREASRRPRRVSRYYAERFDTVEVDSPYYHLPDPHGDAALGAADAAGVLFHVKAHTLDDVARGRADGRPPSPSSGRRSSRSSSPGSSAASCSSTTRASSSRRPRRRSSSARPSASRRSSRSSSSATARGWSRTSARTRSRSSSGTGSRTCRSTRR